MDSSTSDGFLHWLGQAQWGTVPTWFGGLSFVLAILLFWRDRRRDDRELIDKVAVWPIPKYERQIMLDSAAELDGNAQVDLHAKNASDLPVEIHAIAFELTSRWMVPSRTTAGRQVRLRSLGMGGTGVHDSDIPSGAHYAGAR